MGKDDPEVSLKRDQLRERIKANLLAAAAAGHDLEGQTSCLEFCFCQCISDTLICAHKSGCECMTN